MPSSRQASPRPRKRRSKFGGSFLRWLVLIGTIALSILAFLLIDDPFGWNPQGMSGPAGQVTLFASLHTRTPFYPVTDTPVTAGPQPTLISQGLPATRTPGAAPSVEPRTPAAPETEENWWQVYFTDPRVHSDPTQTNGTVLEKLLALINGARSSIHIAAFEFNLTPLADALIAAHQRGVEVRWITDDENGLEADAEPGRGTFEMLQAGGVEVMADDRQALMHHKFFIIDRQIVWTGSTNPTVNDYFLNNNNVVVILSPDLAEIYETQFADMWQGEFGPDAPSEVASQATFIQGTPVQVLFSPEDNAVSYLIPLLRRAQKSIRFMAYSFTHEELAQAMLERAGNNVDVRGIFETRGSLTPYSAFRPFFCARLVVRQDGNPRTFHHKVIIIDDHILITGSLNFSQNANDPNNENVLVIDNRAVAAPYLQEFERRWAEARQPDPAAVTCP